MIRIDLHAHAFSAHTAPKVIVGLLALAHRTCPGFAPHGDGTVPDLLRAEAAAGFDRVAICNIATRPEHHAYMARFLTALSSGAMGEEAARRVIPCVSLHPHDPDAAAHIKALVDLGARMVKLHPYSQNVALDDPAMIRLMAVIRDAGLPILCHTGHDITAGEDDLAAPRRILRVLKAVPGLRLVCAHCAAWKHPETLDLLLGQPIGVDLAFQPATGVEPIIQRFAREHPMEHLYFGSDWPWASPAEHAARIASWGLPQDRLDAIFGTNAALLLNLN